MTPPDVLQGPPPLIHKGFINLLKHIQAFADLTKDGVLPIQAVQILPCGYVELAGVRPF